MEGLAGQAKPAHIRASIEGTIKRSTCAQGHALSSPLSTNHIVGALCIRAQRHSGVVTNRVPTDHIMVF